METAIDNANASNKMGHIRQALTQWAVLLNNSQEVIMKNGKALPSNLISDLADRPAATRVQDVR